MNPPEKAAFGAERADGRRRPETGPCAISAIGAAVFAASLLVLASAGWTGESPRPRLRAVATYSVIYDIARQVAGDRAEVVSLVPLGVDPHTFEPKPGDIRRIAQADLVLYNGFNLELWFDRMVQGSGTRARIVVMSHGVPPIVIRDPLSRYDGTPDPHAWMDVRNVMQHYVPNVRDALSVADPEGAAHYRQRADAFLAQLDALDTWIRSQVARIPGDRRKLVTTENAMRYFADRYGFAVVGWIYTLAPEAEPPARRVVELVERIRTEKVPALFVDLTLNPKLMERISQETGVPISGALYIDTLGGPGSGADSYVGMMRANVERLVAGLSGAP
jgi:ABC-type Zn uptake system ZnuABC Zn-binding protein ZnuA